MLKDSEDWLGVRSLVNSEIKARTHCPMCRLVSNAFNDNTMEKWFGDGRLGDEDISVRMYYIDDHWEDPDIEYERKYLNYRRYQRILLNARNADQTLEVYLVFVDTIPKPQLGQPIVSKRNNDDLVEEWFKTCKDHHGTHCIGPYAANLEGLGDYDNSRTKIGREKMYGFPDINFRLIDLERHCITEASGEEEYCALSYVWGRKPVLRALKGNIESLMTSSGLYKQDRDVPKTIIDAMNMARALGFGKLWVDSLW